MSAHLAVTRHGQESQVSGVQLLAHSRRASAVASRLSSGVLGKVSRAMRRLFRALLRAGRRARLGHLRPVPQLFEARPVRMELEVLSRDLLDARSNAPGRPPLALRSLPLQLRQSATEERQVCPALRKIGNGSSAGRKPHYGLTAPLPLALWAELECSASKRERRDPLPQIAPFKKYGSK